MIQGISHITFRCEDLDKTTHFLQHVFNAELVYDSQAQTFSISKEKFFLIAGTWIAIMEGKKIEKTYNHIAFKVNSDELPVFKSKIEQLGLEILPGRTRNPEGQDGEGESLYFYDYDGHLFELHTGDLQTRLAYYSKYAHTR